MATSSISVGTLSTSTGTPRLTGTSSNIDTEALVTAAYEAKRLPAVRLENRIKTNEAKSAAYGELQGLLTNLRDAVKGLRNPPGSTGIADNLFEAKEAYLTSSTTTAATSLVGIAVEPTASAGSFTLTVERLATAEKQSSAAASSTGADLADAWNGGAAFSGELKIGLDGGAPQTIAVDGTMSLLDLRDAINAKSAESGVGASILKIAEGDYRLILTGKETGRAITLANGTGDDVLSKMGLTQVQAAQKSKFTVDGVEVERTGNTVDDLYPGMSLSLYKAEPGTEVTVAVEPALSSIKEGIQSFVDAYNELRAFVEKHSALSDSGGVAEDAVLFGDRVMRSIADNLSSLIGRSVDGGAAGALATLRDVGIALDENNRLRIDETVLDKKLLTDPDGVRGVFEFGFKSSSADVRVLERTNQLTDRSFTLAIVDANGDGVPESASFDGVAAEVNGGIITGKAGTPYAGLKLSWIGKGDASIDISTRPGVADGVFNAIEDALDLADGPLQQAIDDLTERNAEYRTQIDTIDQRAEAARTRLIERFASMEAAMSLAEVMLQQVRAQMDAMSSDR